MESNRKIFLILALVVSFSGLCLLVLSNFIYLNTNFRSILSGLTILFVGINFVLMPEKMGSKDIKISNKHIGIFMVLVGIFLTVDSVIRTFI
jgi:cytochrome c biogenesis protein CcdA